MADTVARAGHCLDVSPLFCIAFLLSYGRRGRCQI